MRVLFTSPIIEFPAHGGPELRIANTIKALSRTSDLYIIHQINDPLQQNIDSTKSFFNKYTKKYHQVFKRIPDNFFIKIIYKILRRIFSLEPNNVSNEVIDFVLSNDIDVIWFGYGNISYPLIKSIKRALPDIKIVCDTDSVWSRFISRELPYTSGIRRLIIKLDTYVKQREEKQWVDICDITTAVSEVDADYYRSIAKNQNKIQIFSNVIDMDDYINIPCAPEGFKTPSIFLAGSYGPNSAMNMAASWLLDEVMPIIYEQRSDVHLYIVGKASDTEFGDRQDNRVTVTGRVHSVLPYLFHVKAALVPLKFESGTRFKILEAGACKTPIVSTTLGAEGIPVKNEEQILIADSAEEFAKAIIKIIDNQDLGNLLKENCHELIKSNYCVESLSKEADQILRILNHD